MNGLERFGQRIVIRFPYGEHLLDIATMRHLRGHLREVGWLESRRQGLPMDANGKPLPWYTYAFLHFLEPRVRRDFRVFEYGSGNSTLWWASRVDRIVSCEHERAWWHRLAPQLPPHVDYRYCALESGGAYSKMAASLGVHFDVVVIDGRDRVACARHAVEALAEAGVIVWDNSDRPAYVEGFEFLAQRHFRRLDFYGLGPCNAEPWCTSVFYRSGNCLAI